MSYGVTFWEMYNSAHDKLSTAMRELDGGWSRQTDDEKRLDAATWDTRKARRKAAIEKAADHAAAALRALNTAFTDAEVMEFGPDH